jgi:hypothetical protein
MRRLMHTHQPCSLSRRRPIDHTVWMELVRAGSPDEVRWRITRSLRGRRWQVAKDAAGAAGCLGVALALLAVLPWLVTDDEETVVSRIGMCFGWAVASVIVATSGAVLARRVWEVVHRREDHIGLTDLDLWWQRRRPATAGSEPVHVDRLQIARIGLGEADRTVVVTTADGTDHVVTDLGTPADRATLARTIGARLDHGIGRVHPVTAPVLPPGWRVRSDPSGEESVLWRRTTAWRTWGLAVFTYFAVGIGLGQVTIVPPGLRPLLVVVTIALAAALIGRIWFEATRVSTGWFLRNGRLQAVDVHARTGRMARTRGPVTALELTGPSHNGRSRLRLTAILTQPPHHETMTHGLVEQLATWLAERADLPRSRTSSATPGARATTTSR